MMRQYAVIPLILVVWLFAGCQSIPAPKTADQTVLGTYGLYVTVSRMTDDLLQSDTISVAQAKTISSKLQDVRPILDDARDRVQGGRPVTPNTLDIVTAIQKQLLALQRRLQQEQT